MKIFFHLTAIYSAVEVSGLIQTDVPINICTKHLQEHFTGDKYESLNEFKKTISNDYSILEVNHIDICNILLNITDSCEECMESFSTSKIFCKKCNFLNSPQKSCKKCRYLTIAIKHLEIYKLCLRKFIMNKYSQETVKYFIERLRTKYSPYIMLFTLSGISFNSKEIDILYEVFSKLNAENNSKIKDEIDILKTFAKHHFILENKNSMSLLDELLKENFDFTKELILYHSMRFDFNFYSKITSSDLFNFMMTLTSCKFDLNSPEHKILISDVMVKIKCMGVVMDQEDFYKLIELFIENDQRLLYLSYFLKIDGYVEILNEEKLISILMKIFKIKSFKSICPQMNSKIFNESLNDGHVIENNLSENFDRKRFYKQFIEVSNISQPKFTKKYLIYRSIFEMLYTKFTGFTPNGFMKISCVVFSFLNKEINQPSIFKDLIKILYSKQEFSNFMNENILEMINLHFECNIPYDYLQLTILPILNNLKTNDELKKLFDNVFDSANSSVIFVLIVEMINAGKLNVDVVNYFMDCLNNNSPGRTKEFFKTFTTKSQLSIDFQKKYIQRMINQPNIKNFDFFIS